MKPHPYDDLPEAPASGTAWRPPTLDVATLDRIEGASSKGASFVVLRPGGDPELAELAPGVSRELAEECLSEGRPMLVRRTGDQLLILGAVQTQPSPLRLCDGVATLSARELHLAAERRLELEVGLSRVTLGRDGKLSLLGNRLTAHVASLIKLIASKVELP